MAHRRKLSRSLTWTFVFFSLLSWPLVLARGPQVVYDSDFKGYVPIVNGIERPDLAAARQEGRLPESARTARRRGRRGARRGVELRLTPPPPPEIKRRWLSKQAIITEIEVRGPDEFALPGARVYRYSDPSFYAVNDDGKGARLYGTYRYLPYSFPAAEALTAIRLFEELWLDEELKPVLPTDGPLDLWHNPWLHDQAGSAPPPVEFVGTTDLTGRLEVVSGLFDLRDSTRFPRAVVPSSLRLGFVVVANGHMAGLSEKRFDQGGLREHRTITLLKGSAHRLLASPAYDIAGRLFDSMDLSPERDFPEIEDHIDRICGTIEPLAGRYKEEAGQKILAEAEARLIARLFHRAPKTHRIPLARRAHRLTPTDPGRLFRLAQELTALDRELLWAPRHEPSPETSSEREAESILRTVLKREPSFLPAAVLLDELFERRLAEPGQTASLMRRMLRSRPFDRGIRARLATLALDAGQVVEAFDHLRYTWMVTPGLGKDMQLARSLTDYYWRLGLPEKAGTFTWLLTGHPPEDPFVRVRRAVP